MPIPPNRPVPLVSRVAESCLLALIVGVSPALAGDRAQFGLAIEVQPAGRTVKAEIDLDTCGLLPNGAGVALAFDSRVLAFDRIEAVFPHDLLAVDETSEPDEQDLDRDPDTDRLVRIAWFAPLGNWPANAAPTTLARITLDTLPGAAHWSVENALTLTPLGSGFSGPAPLVRRSLPLAGETLAAADRSQRAAETAVAGVHEVSARRWSEETERVPPLCTLDVDGNASFDALTDGILIMRYLFGFSGSSLTAGAVGSGATRSDATAIAEFLADSTCAAMLDADGNGTRDALTDGILIARYLFGFSGATLTANALGSGATRTDGGAIGSFLGTYKTTGPVLVLTAPVLEAPLLSQLPATLQVPTTYTGTGTVSYALATGPSGMTIDGATGVLSWTPPAAMEGQQPSVRVTATDGTLNAEVTFTVRVASGTQVTTSVSGSTVTVTQSGSLQGLAMTLPAQTSIPASQLKVFTVAASQAPPVPASVARVSDFFRTTPVQATSGDITVTIPTSTLPTGVSKEQVRLYVYGEAEASTDLGGVINEPVWLSSSFGLNVLPSGAVTVKADLLGALSFIGYGTGSESVGAPPNTGWTSGPAAGRSLAPSREISCVAQQLANGALALRHAVCMAAGDRSAAPPTVTVRDFATNRWTPATTQQDLVSWIATANAKFTTLGLLSDPALDVVVEDLPKASWLGYVTARNGENRRVLHLARKDWGRPNMQSTVAHEYFHHAQSRTTAPGKANLINTGADWLIEGTARWFEDEVYDANNVYRELNSNPMPRVLDGGLAAANNPAFPGTWPYDKLLFWKLVARACSGFSLPQLLNVDQATDPTGIVNFKEKVESQAFHCDFGRGFGDANTRTLASALLYYTWATVQENDINLLDSNSNEPPFDFERALARIAPSADCVSWTACPRDALVNTFIAPAGTDPVTVSAVPGLTPGQAVTLEVESLPPGKELWVWIGDYVQANDLTKGTWYRSTATIRHTYAEGQPAPAMQVIVVNPDPKTKFDYRMRAGISQSGLVTITFSASGYLNESDLCPWCGQDPYSNTYRWDWTLSGAVTAPCQGGANIDDDPWNGPTAVDIDLWGCPATGEVVFQGTYQITPRFPLAGSTSNGTQTYSWTHTNLRQLLTTHAGPQQFSSPFTCRASLPDQSWDHSGWLCEGATVMDRWRSYTGTTDEFATGQFSVSFDITTTPRTAASEQQP